MFSFISFLGAALVFVSGTLFGLANTSWVRKRAEKAPNSLMFWVIKAFDRLFEATIFRPIYAVEPRSGAVNKSEENTKDSQNARWAKMDDLHDFYGTEELIAVRQSLTISVELAKRLPKQGLNTASGLLLLCIGACLAVAAGLAISLSLIWPGRNLGPAVLIVALIPVALFLTVFSRTGTNPISVLQLLSFFPRLVVSADNRAIHVVSAWGRRYLKNTPDVTFEARSGGLLTTFFVKTNSDKEGTMIFGYPTYMEGVIMSFDDLSDLSVKMKGLIDRARSLPNIGYDEMTG